MLRSLFIDMLSMSETVRRSTVTRFRPRFNQYKPNIKLNGEESRGFKQEKLIENFFLLSHNGTLEDIKV